MLHKMFETDTEDDASHFYHKLVVIEKAKRSPRKKAA
jgi:hypothetical protein